MGDASSRVKAGCVGLDTVFRARTRPMKVGFRRRVALQLRCRRLSGDCGTVDVKPLMPKGRADVALPPGGDLFSHPVTRAVSSALRRFTTVFGMGTGGSTSLKPPGSEYFVSMHHFSQIFKGLPRTKCNHIARHVCFAGVETRCAAFIG